MAWIPAQDVGGDDRQRSDELRIRASNLALSGLSGLQPFADKLAPSLGELWRTTQPRRQNQFAGSRYPPCRRRRKRVFRRSGAIWRGSSGNSCRGQSTSPAV